MRMFSLIYQASCNLNFAEVKDGRMEEVKDGRMEEVKDGRMEEVKDGKMEVALNGLDSHLYNPLSLREGLASETRLELPGLVQSDL